MPLGQMVCGTAGCFIPLAGPIGRKMGKTPTIYHQHTRELIHITRNCSSQERQTFHTGAMSPCLIHDTPGRSRTTSRRLPSPGEIELCRPNAAFAEWRQGGSGTAQLHPPGAAGAVGKDRDREGYPGLSIHAPSPSQQRQMPAHFPGCWRSRRRPCSDLLPGTASGSFPGEASAVKARVQPPCRSSPCLAAEHACHCWEMGGRAGRTASSRRRVISCHRLPVPELWLQPGGSKRSR